MGKLSYQYTVSMICRLSAAEFQQKHKMLDRALLQFNPLIHVVNKTNGFDVKHNYFDYSSRGECFFLLLLCV